MSTDLQITPLAEWLDTGGKPLVIAGPCSAESEFQVMETARRIAEIPQVKVFMAGLCGQVSFLFFLLDKVDEIGIPNELQTY